MLYTLEFELTSRCTGLLSGVVRVGFFLGMQIFFIIPLLNFILPACDYSNFDRPEHLTKTW